MSDIGSLLQTWLLPGATFALACGTVGLAWYTRKMAQSTEKALEQNARLVEETHELVESNKILIQNEDRHHQENLRPLCIFHYNNFNGNYNTFLSAVDINTFLVVSVKSNILNVGNGPAKQVFAILRTVLPLNECKFVLDPLAANSHYSRDGGAGHMGFNFNLRREDYNAYSASDFLSHCDWVIYIECRDIFGNGFHTAYVKDGTRLEIWFFDGPVPTLENDPFLTRFVSVLQLIRPVPQPAQ